MQNLCSMTAPASPNAHGWEVSHKHHQRWHLLVGVVLLIFSGLAAATTTINQQFTPATINPGDSSTYRISIANSSLVQLTEAAVTVLLPGAVKLTAAPTGNTCSFTINAADVGTSKVYLTAGTIPAKVGSTDGTCYFEIPVSSIAPGNHEATIPANTTPSETVSGYTAIENGATIFNTTPASATLSVNTLQNPTGSKNFSPSPAIAGDPTTLTITLTNPNAGAAIPLTTFTDNLPLGMVVADPASDSTTCSGGTVTAVPGADSITLTGGVIPVKVGGTNGTCTITAKVVVANPGSVTNTLGAGAIGNTRGLTSDAFSKPLTVNTPIAVSKVFSPDTIPSGMPSKLTIAITNRSTTNPLTINSFEDDLTGATQKLKILSTSSTPNAASANPTVTCTGTGAVNGTLTAPVDLDDQKITLTGATAGPGGTCTITAYVTSNTEGTFTNSIPVNAVVNPNGYSSPAASDSLTVSAPITVDKTVSVSNVAPGQWTQFTVTINNWSGGEVNNLNFVDNLPAASGSQMVLEGANPVSHVGCTGGTWSGADGASSLTWSGGTVVAGSGTDPGVCTIVFKARLPSDAATALTFKNQIPAYSITGGDGGAITNPYASPAVNVISASAVALVKDFRNQANSVGISSIPLGGIATLRLRLRNRVINNDLTTINLTDNLPEGLVLAANPAATNSCGGSLQAFPNTSQVVLNGGSITARAEGSEYRECTITVKVTGTTLGNKTNTITPANLTTSSGTISGNANASLNITAGLSGTKGFTPASVSPGGVARAKVTLTNNSNGQLTNVSVDDSGFGTGLSVANPANASTNCGGSPTIVANPGAQRAQLFGANLPAGGSCDFFFDVSATGDGSGETWKNTIPTGAITSAEGPASTSAVTATLGLATASISINKSFDPVIVTGGQPSVLRIDVTNSSSTIAMHGVGFTDTFPLGIEVYSVPNASTTCPGGVVTAIPGDGKVILSGATLAASQSCQVYVTTTSVRFLNLTNSIPAQAIVTDEGYTNPQGTSASLSTLQGLGIMKGFAPDFIGPDQTARLKMRLVSTFDPNAPTPVTLTGVSYTDTLPDGVFVHGTPNPTTTCAGTGDGGKAVVSTSNDAAKGVITVSQATIPPGSNCTIEVDVTASALGAYTNVIAQNSVISDQDIRNQIEARATLNVVTSPTVTKAFQHESRNPGQSNRLTVTISNNDPNQALTGVSLTDTLPPGLAIAATPGAGTTCTGGTVTAVAGGNTLRLTNATIAKSASCTFYVDVVGNAAGSYTNNINAMALVTNQGVTNPGAATAVMAVGYPPTVSKSFSPVSIATGGTSTLTINLGNSNATSAITLTSALVDVLPGNAGGTGQLVVANSPTIGGTCASGNVTATGGASSITYASGATIPAGGCTITVPVTTATNGVYTNIIAAGQLETSAGKNQQPASASLAVGDGALVPPTVAKSFSPGSVAVGAKSKLTITLGNPNTSNLTLNADFTDTLPANVVVADPLNVGGTCTAGSVTATTGATAITYANNATIPAGGCTIEVDVTSATAGSYTNTIAAGDLKTNGGNNLQPASAGLVVQAQTPPTVTKSFDPSIINPGGTSRLTINLGNAHAGDITLSAGLTDALPTGVTVAGTPNVGGTCTKESVTAEANSGTITYASGATIPAGGCTIQVDVTASDNTQSPYTNTIAAGDLQTSAGNNGAAATARLFVNPPQLPSLNKYFSPSTILVNGISTLTLSFGNGNLAGTALTADLVDTLPFNVRVAADPNIQASSGCDSNKVVAAAGSNTVTYQSGGTIPGGGCYVSVDVTSGVANSGYINTLAAGALQTDFGNSPQATTATLTVTTLAATKTVAVVSDGNSNGKADPGDTLEYSIALRNTGGSALTNVVLTDDIPANTAYVADSIKVNDAARTDANDVDDSKFESGRVTSILGTLAANATATLKFRVTVNAVVPNGTVISNQGVVDSDQTVPMPTDADGNPANGAQPTDIPVGGFTTGALYAEKRVRLYTDTNNNGEINTGDVMEYTLTLNNRGNTALTGVRLTDTLPSGLTYVANSAAVPSDTAISVNGSALTWASLANAATGFTLEPNSSAVATFRVTVTNDAANGGTFTNQAAVAYNDGADKTTATDSNGSPEDGNQPTVFRTGAGAASLDVQKRWTLFTDANANSQPDVGDTLRYSLTVTNAGLTTANDVVLTDPIPANTAVVSGSVLTSQGTVTGQTPNVIVNIGSLAPGAVATVSFRVTISGAEGGLVSNQATVTRTGDATGVKSDDNGNPSDGLNPTLTPVGGQTRAVTKALHATSETASNGNDVLIGEVLTY